MLSAAIVVLSLLATTEAFSGGSAHHARMSREKRAGAAGDNAGNPCRRLDGSSSSLSSRGITIVSSDRIPLKWSSSSSSSSSSSGSSSNGKIVVLDSSSSNVSPVFSANLASSVSSTSSSAPAAPSFAAAYIAPGSSSGMKAVQSWSGNDFLSWTFFHYADPTHGNVNYVSKDVAQSSNLVGLNNGQFQMSIAGGAPVNGSRNSVRISSPANWKKGQLLVGDFAHLPEGCGTWPAFWSIGAKRAWPAGGEIDILEGVNSSPGNTYTLHTTAGCSATNSAGASTMLLTKDCQYQPGCSYKDTDAKSYGPSFNQAGGGVYAAFFDDSGIKIWFWSRANVPASVSAGSPDMSTFGNPKAAWSSSSCTLDQFFDAEQMIIINTTLMGDWAGATFWDNGCTGTLADAMNNANNVANAYWLINSVKIYQ